MVGNEDNVCECVGVCVFFFSCAFGQLQHNIEAVQQMNVYQSYYGYVQIRDGILDE
jgi:hypothetical protein